MPVHLFASDPSVFSLVPVIAERDYVRAIIYPGNRSNSEKVAALKNEAGDIPIFEHRRGEMLPDDLPDADCAVSWLYSQIFSAEILERYTSGILNMHGGAIPAYRGASVLQWAIVNGEAELGVTWHSLVEEVDAGPIWAETRLPIYETATAADIREAIIAAAISSFPEAWTAFRSATTPLRIPDLKQGRVWPQRGPKDGLIEANWPEDRVRNMVRALCAPWPPAYVMDSGAPFAVERISNHPEGDALPYRTQEGRIVYLCASERPIGI